MAKTKISEFSATPGNNTDIDGINIAEGCAPSGINDAIRELMAQLKDFQTGSAGDSFNGPVGTTTAAAGAFTTLSFSGTSGLTFPDNSTQATAASGFGFKNRIINGAMVIDQRNAGASVTPTSAGYTLDRFSYQLSQASKAAIQQNAGSVTPPTGFSNYLGVTSSSAYSVGASESFYIFQRVEGFNFADMAWGTANAQTVTLSFWVRSSLTGTFGAAVWNSAANRAYPVAYTINAANTWEYKTITIPGDTTGTWIGATNGIGVNVAFGLGFGSSISGTSGAWNAGTAFMPTGATSVVGTNGATFYITGVQLEKGSTATSFDYRPYGTELALCQRYYYKIKASGGDNVFGAGYCNISTQGQIHVPFMCLMRTNPSALETSGTASDYSLRVSGGGVLCNSVPTFGGGSTFSGYVLFPVASGLTALSGTLGMAQNSSAFLAWSAEL